MQAAASWHFSAGSIVPPGPTIVHLVTPADGQALTASVTISAFVGKMHLDKVRSTTDENGRKLGLY